LPTLTHFEAILTALKLFELFFPYGRTVRGAEAEIARVDWRRAVRNIVNDLYRLSDFEVDEKRVEMW